MGTIEVEYIWNEEAAAVDIPFSPTLVQYNSRRLYDSLKFFLDYNDGRASFVWIIG